MYKPSSLILLKKSTPKKFPSNLISLEYNISNFEKPNITNKQLIKATSAKLEENKNNYSPAVQAKIKFPIITMKSQKMFADKSNELDLNIKKQPASLENIPNQADLMFSNMKLNPGVRYSDNVGNIKTNENKIYSPQTQIFSSYNSNTIEKPIRMSRNDYLNMVKNQGNFIRKKYIDEAIKIPIKETVSKNFIQEKERKNNKNPKIDIIDEKSPNLENENDNSVHEEERNTIIDRVGNSKSNNYNYNYKRGSVENNKANKKNENVIVINNPLYLKELLLCD